MKAQKRYHDKFTADTTELIDLILYRPLGYQCARVCAKLNISPNQVSTFDIFIGIGAALLLVSNSTPLQITAALLLNIYMILDCTDGQLARMSNRCTPLGAILDLAGDILTSLFIVVGTGIYMIQHYSIPYSTLLISISFLSVTTYVSLHYFYASEYAWLHDRATKSEKRSEAFLFENIQNASTGARFFSALIRAYIKFLYSLVRITNRSRYNRVKRNEPVAYQANLPAEYLAAMQQQVRCWSYLGTSTVLFVLSICVLFGRLEIFLWLTATLGSAYFFLVNRKQNQLDRVLSRDVSEQMEIDSSGESSAPN